MPDLVRLRQNPRHTGGPSQLPVKALGEIPRLFTSPPRAKHLQFVDACPRGVIVLGWRLCDALPRLYKFEGSGWIAVLPGRTLRWTVNSTKNHCRL